MHSLLWFLDEDRKEVAEPFNNFFTNMKKYQWYSGSLCG